MSRLSRAIHAFVDAWRAQQPARPALPEPAAADQARRQAAAQILGLFQREGRLIDFLREELAGYTDAQVGAAVREIHQGCRRALERHVTLAPVLDGADGATIRIPDGIAPAAIRWIGAAGEQPPVHGTLRHHGWRVTELRLPELTAGADPTILAPAQVEADA